MDNIRIDTAILISAIQERRCIWDSSNVNYKNKAARNRAFREIAGIVVADFANHTETNKNAVLKIVEQRWRTARDAYRRDRLRVLKQNSGQSTKIFRKYVFYKKLRFLDSVLKLNRTKTSVFNNVKEGESGNKHVDSGPEDTESKTQACNEVEDVTGVTSKSNNSGRKKSPNKSDILANQLISFLEDSSKKASNEEDSDRAFLISLLPFLRCFEEEKKLQFRAEVLRLMMEMKNVRPFRSSIE